MTTLPKALKDSGIVPPVIQRVWQWIKDNGAHDTNAVAVALGIKHNTASSTLGILVDRGMATRKKEMDQSTNNLRFVYTASGKLKKYELLPITQAAKDRPKRGYAAPEKTEEPKDIFTRVPAADKDWTDFTRDLPAGPGGPKPVESVGSRVLDSMNVREAHALYLELKAMFTGEK